MSEASADFGFGYNLSRVFIVVTRMDATQVYIEMLHTHIDVLHLQPQHRLEPCKTLREEFMRHEHRSPKLNDIFKLRLMLPKFNEDPREEAAAELLGLEALQGRKRSLDETNCGAGGTTASSSPYSTFSNWCTSPRPFLSLDEHGQPRTFHELD